MTMQETDNSPYVLANMSGPVLWLMLNRPQQRNPLSSHMITALKAAIDSANDNPEVRVIVITGSGPVFPPVTICAKWVDRLERARRTGKSG